MNESLEHYDAILDFCRDVPQRKYNIQMEFGFNESKLGCYLKQLVKRGYLIPTRIEGKGRMFEYLSKPDARYEPAGRSYNTNPIVNKPSAVIKEGNVTRVSSNSYHTKGNRSKRSVWVGSTADFI